MIVGENKLNGRNNEKKKKKEEKEILLPNQLRRKNTFRFMKTCKA
jgi:hypothetical protein